MTRSMSSAHALRQIEQARAGLKKARRLLAEARADLRDGQLDDIRRAEILRFGWKALSTSHKLLAEIAVEAADERVMTKQLAAERYATALLVRLRRLLKNQLTADDGLDDEIEAADDDA